MYILGYNRNLHLRENIRKLHLILRFPFQNLIRILENVAEVSHDKK